jgi:hypothetical protein
VKIPQLTSSKDHCEPPVCIGTSISGTTALFKLPGELFKASKR